LLSKKTYPWFYRNMDKSFLLGQDSTTSKTFASACSCAQQMMAETAKMSAKTRNKNNFIICFRLPSGCLRILLEELFSGLIITRIPTAQAAARMIKSIRVANRSAAKAIRAVPLEPGSVSRNQWQKATTERERKNNT